MKHAAAIRAERSKVVSYMSNGQLFLGEKKSCTCGKDDLDFTKLSHAKCTGAKAR